MPTNAWRLRAMILTPNHEEQAMATIVIKDLPDNIELDRAAMVAIKGGMRARSRATALGRALFQDVRGIGGPAPVPADVLPDNTGRASKGTPRD